MQFGNHVPTETRQKGMQSPMAEFTRGLSFGGNQWKFAFDNGFGASVIDDGYGREDGRYELAVLDSGGHLTYSTPVTDDVLGHQTAEDIAAALDQIAALTPMDVAAEKVRRLNAEIDEKREQIAKIYREIAALSAEVTS